MKLITIALVAALATPAHAFDIAEDKQGHAVVGMALTAHTIAATGNPLLGAAVGVGAGAVKELVDPAIHGHQDVGDFAFTAGAAAITALILAATMNKPKYAITPRKPMMESYRNEFIYHK